MKYRRTGIAGLVVIVCGFAAWRGALWWAERQWFALQSQQLATIRRLEEFAAVGWDQQAWNNAVCTLHNVWGNVTYHPKCSNISNAEMRSLASSLHQILTETTRQDSSESVDRVFELLLQRGQKADFIEAYREEFNSEREEVRRRVGGAGRTESFVGIATTQADWPYRYRISRTDGTWSGTVDLRVPGGWAHWDKMHITDQVPGKICFRVLYGESDKAIPSGWHLTLGDTRSPTFSGILTGDWWDSSFVELLFSTDEGNASERRSHPPRFQVQ
jgi:hypothetical protein